MRHRSTALVLLAAAALALPACADPHVVAKSPLRRPRMSPQTTALDVFFARVPYGDPDANDSLWQELDEQTIPADVRRRLAENGLRVGVASGRLPVALERILELGKNSATQTASDNLGVDDAEGSPQEEVLTTNAVRLDTDPLVNGRHVQCLDGEACLLLANDRHQDELYVLLPSDDGLRGRRFTNAQGVFDVTPNRQPDGRVRLRLLPKIKHGQLSNHFEAQDAFASLVSDQQSEQFENLAAEADLAAGDVLVVACDPQCQGSLGQRLLTIDQDGTRMQKLIVVRVAQTQHDPLLTALMQDDDNDDSNATVGF